MLMITEMGTKACDRYQSKRNVINLDSHRAADNKVQEKRNSRSRRQIGLKTDM